jgi:hypothetical protein
MPLIHVDDHELSWAEFGTSSSPSPAGACASCAHELDEEPEIAVREPDGQE